MDKECSRITFPDLPDPDTFLESIITSKTGSKPPSGELETVQGVPHSSNASTIKGAPVVYPAPSSTTAIVQTTPTVQSTSPIVQESGKNSTVNPTVAKLLTTVISINKTSKTDSFSSDVALISKDKPNNAILSLMSKNSQIVNFINKIKLDAAGIQDDSSANEASANAETEFSKDMGIPQVHGKIKEVQEICTTNKPPQIKVNLKAKTSQNTTVPKASGNAQPKTNSTSSEKTDEVVTDPVKQMKSTSTLDSSTKDTPQKLGPQQDQCALNSSKKLTIKGVKSTSKNTASTSNKITKTKQAKKKKKQTTATNEKRYENIVTSLVEIDDNDIEILIQDLGAPSTLNPTKQVNDNSAEVNTNKTSNTSGSADKASNANFTNEKAETAVEAKTDPKKPDPVEEDDEIVVLEVPRKVFPLIDILSDDEDDTQPSGLDDEPTVSRCLEIDPLGTDGDENSEYKEIIETSEANIQIAEVPSHDQNQLKRKNETVVGGSGEKRRNTWRGKEVVRTESRDSNSCLTSQDGNTTSLPPNEVITHEELVTTKRRASCHGQDDTPTRFGTQEQGDVRTDTPHNSEVVEDQARIQNVAILNLINEVKSSRQHREQDTVIG